MQQDYSLLVDIRISLPCFDFPPPSGIFFSPERFDVIPKTYAELFQRRRCLLRPPSNPVYSPPP